MNQQQISELEKVIISDYNNIAGIVVSDNRKTLYENYFNECTADTAVHVSSVTKSIISVLIGIAIDNGFIRSTEQKILDFFLDYTIKRGEKTIQSVSVKNMLTMTAPYKYKSAPYTKYFTSDDWVKSALDLLGGKKPIGEFRYAPLIGPDILTGILMKTTGQSVLDFAREYLFTPLGIDVADNLTFANKEEQLAFYKTRGISGWVSDPKGVNTAGWGLTLTAMDMAKIGQLYLNDGKWNGKQIVSVAWIDESIKEHSRWEEQNLPYGYLWWVGIGTGYAAMGDGGNVIYINPNNNIVVSIASLFKPRAKDRIALITEYIEPLF
ncbi:MAG: beta-lactamase family protein [Oscillospiraceae bacterium]|jgi:CubicO group peptidase (beta-lactamase class C family)|nr:beta-lactamase family protein [Oscillospiraceae bacterium]